MDILVKPIVTEKMTVQPLRFCGSSHCHQAADQESCGEYVRCIGRGCKHDGLRWKDEIEIHQGGCDLWEDQFLQEGDRHAGEGRKY